MPSERTCGYKVKVEVEVEVEVKAMNKNDLLERLERIEEALRAKGHPMQDYSTLKMAMFDLIEVLREVLKDRLE